MPRLNAMVLITMILMEWKPDMHFNLGGLAVTVEINISESALVMIS